MSNIKISNLPLIPSVSPDDVLPIVDSGFTTTYKVKVSSLQGTSGTSGVSGSSGTSGTSGLGFTWQGGWQSITTYFINDVVYYSGASYIALGTIAAGGNPPDVNASWENMNAQGQSGSSGTSGVSGSSGTSGVSGSSGTSGTSGTSGASNSVYSGGTLVVSGATILNFSGATITDAGGGQANITINSGGGLVNGTGTSSLKQQDGLTTTPATASGTNSIAIGNGVGAAGTNSVAIGGNAATNGDDAVSIGNTYGFPISANAVSIGRHPGLGAGLIVSIGSSGSVSGNFSIGIGHDIAATNGGIVLGSSSRAGANNITLGNSNDWNLGEYCSILGYNNEIANFFYGPVLYSNGGTYNNIFSNNSKIGFSGVTNYTGNTIIGGNNNVILADGSNNTIIGGGGNSITGNTSGTTLLGISNSTAPLENDTAYLNNIKSIGKYTQLGTKGGNNTITGSGPHTIIGSGNTLGGDDTAHFVIGYNNISNYSNTGIGNIGSFIFGQNNTSNSGRWNTIFGWSNSVEGNGSQAFGDGHSVYGTNSTCLGSTNQTFGTGYALAGGYGCNIVGGDFNFSYGYNNDMSGGGNQNAILGGTNNTITSTQNANTIIGGVGNSITGGTRQVMLGCSGRTATTSSATFVENLVVFNYAALDFNNDTAAAAGGVVLGQVYHNAGALRIRIV